MELILGEDGAFKVVGEGYNSGQGGCRRTGSKDKCTNAGRYFTIKLILMEDMVFVQQSAHLSTV